MNYRNSEMRLDQIINYFNEQKINLIPPFQRGRVWSPKLRRGLIKNIVQGKPIPAIFLYKEESGSRYSYNILDGKQRLESLILFVGDQRPDLLIKNWRDYFFGTGKNDGNFWIELSGKKSKFKDLGEEVVRDFREYAIPTIEISLNDDSSLDEVISLFVDINQFGVKVNRFDIVKAMGKNNKLLSDVFDILALKQKRRQDTFYRQQSNEFTSVLRRLQVVDNLTDPNSRVDRMWERLLEIVLFLRNRKHQPPTQILKSFIRGGSDRSQSQITKKELAALRKVFRFLRSVYRVNGVSKSRLATDQTYFYTMITTIIDADLLEKYMPDNLKKKLSSFANIIDGKTKTPASLLGTIKKFKELSTKQTTHPGRRTDRQTQFLKAIGEL